MMTNTLIIAMLQGTLLKATNPSNVELSFESLFTDISHDAMPNLPTLYRPHFVRLMELAEEFEKRTDIEKSGLGRLPPYIGREGSEKRRDQMDFGEIQYIGNLASTSKSRVLTARVPRIEKPVVVKYTNDCPLRLTQGVNRDPSMHPSVIEFKYYELLQHSGLVPKTYYLSPVAQFTGDVSYHVPKSVQTDYLVARLTECVDAGTEVRFIVQDLTGPSVHDYLDYMKKISITKRGKRVSFLHACMKVGIKIIKLIEKLHAYGVAHGDMHFGNIMFKNPVKYYSEIDVDEAELVFIDLEMAVFFGSEFGKDIKGNRNKDLVRMNLSPWQIMNERIARRDDVWRAIELLADALSQNGFMKPVDRILAANLKIHGNLTPYGDSYRAIEDQVCLWYKTSEPLFKYSIPLASGCCNGMGLTVKDQNQVQNILEEIVHMLRAYKHPDNEPQYKLIIEKMNKALSVIQ